MPPCVNGHQCLLHEILCLGSIPTAGRQPPLVVGAQKPAEPVEQRAMRAGVADIRGKPDREVIARMLAITRSAL